MVADRTNVLLDVEVDATRPFRSRIGDDEAPASWCKHKKLFLIASSKTFLSNSKPNIRPSTLNFLYIGLLLARFDVVTWMIMYESFSLSFWNCSKCN